MVAGIEGVSSPHLPPGVAAMLVPKLLKYEVKAVSVGEDGKVSVQVEFTVPRAVTMAVVRNADPINERSIR